MCNQFLSQGEDGFYGISIGAIGAIGAIALRKMG